MNIINQRGQRSVSAFGLAYVLLMTLLVAAGGLAYWLGSDSLGLATLPVGQLVASTLGVWIALCGVMPLLLGAWDRLLKARAERVLGREPLAAGSGALAVPSAQPLQWPRQMRQHLRAHYGPRWRRQVRLLLVFGEPDELEAIAPGLAAHRWIEGRDAVLIWAGSLAADLDPALTRHLASLSRWRALDGAVWALSSAQSAEPVAMAAGLRRLQKLARALRWTLALHLWQVGSSAWPQRTRESRAVGCLLDKNLTPHTLQSSLEQLLPGLLAVGMQQVLNQRSDDFCLRLSQELQDTGIARWRECLTPMLAQRRRGIELRGLWFSLALARVDAQMPHHWPLDPAWDGVLAAPAHRARWLGNSPMRMGFVAVSCLMLMWAAGLVLSFASNRAQIAQVQTALRAVQSAAQGDLQLQALNELMHRVALLGDRPAPWYQRFGLSTHQALLDTLWPRYVAANARLIRDPAAAYLEQQLEALVQLAPNSPARAAGAHQAYLHLKAYLMLANPSKADAAFLREQLQRNEPSRSGITPATWQYLAPQLWGFYARQLPSHPGWAISPDTRLIAQARQVLIGQLGQRTGEAALYTRLLADAQARFAPLQLQQMTADTDATRLFSSRHSVPGVYTREAWEGHVRGAIEQIAAARREQIDWVLSDSQADVAASLTPEALKQRLTARYFHDYAGAWLRFANGLHWQPAANLGEVIEQLTLMSDSRQSPLIALIDTLAYQGQAGTRQPRVTEALTHSAERLITTDKPLAIEQLPAAGPLDATFGPLLALLGNRNDTSAALNLPTLLNRITRTRLKLEQITHASDPQAMTQALAQSVLQGNNADLSDTQAYAGLLAASLGAQWHGAGQTLFVQPLEQAWQRVLQPSSVALNQQWQRAIVDPWHSAFTGRYPFAASASDASLPMLGQMIRADSGRIDQFLRQQLGGVLRKEGSRWGVDPSYSQGLVVNPRFLSAVNELGHLADVLFTDGGMGIGFELSGKPVKDVVETLFVLDGQKHEYFNQQERWQSFRWPGLSPAPGTRLSWISVQRDSRQLYADYQGVWGLIRWLEQARVRALDDGESRFELVINAPDGLGLTWHLRTELGRGPLALLRLRGFDLPKEIFLGSTGAARQGGGA